MTTPEQNRMKQHWPEIVEDLKIKFKVKQRRFYSDDENARRRERTRKRTRKSRYERQLLRHDNDQNNDQNKDQNNDQNNENDENEDEKKENKKPDDIFKEEDEIDNIRPYPIGRIPTTKYVYDILHDPRSIFLPKTREEVVEYTTINNRLRDKKIKKSDYISYIERRIDRLISSKFTIPQLNKIEIDVGFLVWKYWSENLENDDLKNVKKSGGKLKVKGKNKRKIVGKGIIEPKKIFINKFTIDVEKYKKNILSVK